MKLDKRPITCIICGRTCKSPTGLSVHLRSHARPKQPAPLTSVVVLSQKVEAVAGDLIEMADAMQIAPCTIECKTLALALETLVRRLRDACIVANPPQ